MTETAKAKSRNLGTGGFYIEHAALTEDDLVWLASVERLVLWDVSVPSDFLTRLPSLWWIDWRGGSAQQGISQIQLCEKLRYLALNQIRGLSDLSFIMHLTALEMINFHGLSKVAIDGKLFKASACSAWANEIPVVDRCRYFRAKPARASVT